MHRKILQDFWYCPHARLNSGSDKVPNGNAHALNTGFVPQGTENNCPQAQEIQLLNHKLTVTESQGGWGVKGTHDVGVGWGASTRVVSEGTRKQGSGLITTQ